MISGRTIVVTGGTSGIGRGLVKRLAEQDAAARPALVVATARDPSSDAARSLLSECSSGGDGAKNVRVLRLDVTDEASVSAWADELASLVPHVDMCVANAGVYGTRGGLLDLSAADFDLCFRTNATGPFLVVQALAKRGLLGARPEDKPPGAARPFPRELLLAAGGEASSSPGALPPLRPDAEGGVTSVVALMSSVLASHGDSVVSAVAPGGHAYRASKGALNAIGHAFCVGLAPQGIATTTLHPGYVKGTSMTGNDGWLTVDESCDGLMALLTGGRASGRSGGGGGGGGSGSGGGAPLSPKPLHGRWWHAGTLEEIPW